MAQFFKQPIALSLGFHILVVTLFTIGWPFFNSDETDIQPLIVVDIVRTVPNTNLAAAESGGKAADVEQEETRKKPPPPPPPAPVPKPVAQTKPTPKATPKATPKPVADAIEILPTKTVSAPVTRPKPKAPQANKKPVSAPVSRPKPPQKKAMPSPKVKPNKLAQKSRQKEKADALNGLLQNLAEATQAKEAEENQKAQKKALNKKLAQNLTAAVGDALKTPSSSSIMPLGVSDIDRLRSHISKHWTPPVGAKGARQLKVDIFVKLERDGKVTRAEIVDKSRFNRDKLFSVAARAARSAILEASPLPLPAEKYELWKEFIFGFDPINM
jgi:outer membrane biosynthesis protein TonB